MAKKIKTSVGEVEIGKITWKQIKEAGLMKLIKKIGSSDDVNDIFGLIDDEDIDKAVRLVAGNKIDEMTFDDVIKVFEGVMEAITSAKK